MPNPLSERCDFVRAESVTDTPARHRERFPFANIWRLAVGVLTLFLAVACGASQKEFDTGKPGDTRFLVRKIKLEGVKHGDEDLLRRTLATQTLSLNPFGQNRFLNRYEVASDVPRIETFYHMNGFFDARVTSQPDINYDEEVFRATVHFTVEEGDASVVSETRIVDARSGSLDPVTAAASGFGYLVSRVDRKLPLKRGRVFSYENMQSSAALLRRRLQELGYARAKVEARAYVSRQDHQVIVVYRIDPGAVCVFGDITIEGNNRLPERFLRRAIDLDRGTDFRPSLIDRARNRLYGLDAFQVVDIITGLDKAEEHVDPIIDGDSSARPGRVIASRLPDYADPFDEAEAERYLAMESAWLYESHTFDRLVEQREAAATHRHGWMVDATSAALALEGYDPVLVVAAEPAGVDTTVAARGIDFSQVVVEDPHIDILVRVAESPAAAYRFGFGGEIDSGRWVAFTRANAIWRDVFGPLNTFEADLRLGYAWLPTPVFGTLEDNDVRNRGVIARAELRYKRPQLLFGVWNFHAGVKTEKNVELIYDLFTVGGDLGIDRRWGNNFRLSLGYNIDYNQETSTVETSKKQYRLAWLHGNAVFDFRDNAMQPTRGFYGELLAELGDPLTGEFLFVQIRPDLRGYIPVTRRFTIAVRGMVGWLISLPSSNKVPANHRLYEGGATSFRGVPYRRLSPHQFRLQDNDPTTPDNQLFDASSDCQSASDTSSGGDPSRTYSCRAEPQGGFFSAIVSVEPRYEIGRDWLHGALFFDAGTVQNSIKPSFALNENDWHLAAGAGLRVATPLGPIRLDVAYRFTNADAFAGLNRLVFFLAIGEAF